MRKFLKILLSLFVITSASLNHVQAQSLDLKEIAIVASSPIPDNIKPSKVIFEQVADCGFNTVFCYAASEKILDAIIDAMYESKLKLMPASSVLRSDKCGEFVEKYRSDTTVIGWDFVDEPLYDQLNLLKKYYDVIKTNCSGKIIYMNLIGAPNKKCVGLNKTYRDYLNDIESRFHPQIWSYDIYPIVEVKGKLTFSNNYFYSTLEDFSYISKKTGYPFWSYCQSMSVRFSNGNMMPAATVPYLRFEAFSALAYGAQGIVYWTYGQRLNTKTETYQSALLDLNGRKTSAWYAANQVNSEIKALNSVFYKSQLVDCRHTGDKIYEGTRKLTGAFGPLKNIRAGSKGVIVSHLNTGGQDYLVIVSRDPFNKQTVRLNFQDNVNVEELSVVSSDDKYKLERYRRSGLVKKRLPAGGYLIFQWN